MDSAALRGRFFVAGTDTGVGKTWTACRLLSNAKAQGLSCYGLKPVAAGCEQTPEGPRNDDALALMAASSVAMEYDWVNPVALRTAIAPHVAAQQENRRLSADRLLGYVQGTVMSHLADLILVEGAGGWRVPLNDRESLAHLAVGLQWPVILVVGMRLGCLNHALLTAEAIERDGLILAGWVANDLGDPMPHLAENIETLEHWLPAPRIGV